MSAFYIWMSQQEHLCMRLMEERWKTADLEEAFNAGMERAADKIDSRITEHTRTEIWEILTELKKEIRMEISND